MMNDITKTSSYFHSMLALLVIRCCWNFFRHYSLRYVIFKNWKLEYIKMTHSLNISENVNFLIAKKTSQWADETRSRGVQMARGDFRYWALQPNINLVRQHRVSPCFFSHFVGSKSFRWNGKWGRGKLKINGKNSLKIRFVFFFDFFRNPVAPLGMCWSVFWCTG